MAKRGVSSGNKPHKFKVGDTVVRLANGAIGASSEIKDGTVCKISHTLSDGDIQVDFSDQIWDHKYFVFSETHIIDKVLDKYKQGLPRPILNEQRE